MTMRDLSEIGEVGACLLGDPRRLGRPHASQEFQGIHAANSSTTLPECNSALLAHDGSNLRCNAGMENKAIRRANLAGLIREFETIARLARRTGAVASLLSQIKNGTRQMGDDVARRLERALDKPEGWMDLPQFGAGDAMMDQAEALQILQSLTESDRDAWLKHGRLLVESNGQKGPNNPFGHVPKGPHRGGQ